MMISIGITERKEYKHYPFAIEGKIEILAKSKEEAYQKLQLLNRALDAISENQIIDLNIQKEE